MSFSADTLNQAREALVAAYQQNLNLVSQIKEQGRKIVDLEREVQKQMNSRAQAEQALAQLTIEVEALRSQIPSDATVSAYNALEQFLAAPAQEHPALRLAA
jgi:hypothetical protein